MARGRPATFATPTHQPTTKLRRRCKTFTHPPAANTELRARPELSDAYASVPEYTQVIARGSTGRETTPHRSPVDPLRGETRRPAKRRRDKEEGRRGKNDEKDQDDRGTRKRRRRSAAAELSGRRARETEGAIRSRRRYLRKRRKALDLGTTAHTLALPAA